LYHYYHYHCSYVSAQSQCSAITDSQTCLDRTGCVYLSWTTPPRCGDINVCADNCDACDPTDCVSTGAGGNYACAIVGAGPNAGTCKGLLCANNCENCSPALGTECEDSFAPPFGCEVSGRGGSELCVPASGPTVEPSCDLKTGVYEVLIQGGMNDPYKRHLSVTPDGRRVDLWTHNDASGRQEWRVEKTEYGYYHIKILSGVGSGRDFLSVSRSGKTVDLWPYDDNSGRQRWVVLPIEGNKGACNVKVYGGIDSDRDYGTRTFLSVPPSGKYTDLWYKDDNSGRQQWVFTRID